jgi:hypothetical protein
MILGLFIFGLTSCRDDESTVLETTPVAIEFEDVRLGMISGNPIEAGAFVINDQAEWSAFKAYANEAYGSEVEYQEFEDITVDFTAYTLLAVVDQWYSSGGYKAQILSVIESGGAVTATVNYSAPGEGNVTSIHCQPFHIVKIPKTTLLVTFTAQ